MRLRGVGVVERLPTFGRRGLLPLLRHGLASRPRDLLDGAPLMDFALAILLATAFTMLAVAVAGAVTMFFMILAIWFGRGPFA